MPGASRGACLRDFGSYRAYVAAWDCGFDVGLGPFTSETEAEEAERRRAEE
jgi:hypothetical protein